MIDNPTLVVEVPKPAYMLVRSSEIDAINSILRDAHETIRTAKRVEEAPGNVLRVELAFVAFAVIPDGLKEKLEAWLMSWIEVKKIFS